MPKKQKLAVEEKIIRRCLSGEIGVIEASRIAGVDTKAIYQWIARYETEGVEVFLPQERNRVYSPEMKLQAVLDYLASKGTQQDICKKYKIRSTRQLRNWIKMYNAHGNFNTVKQAGGGSYMKQGRETTQEECIQIAKECIASGKNWRDVTEV